MMTDQQMIVPLCSNTLQSRNETTMSVFESCAETFQGDNDEMMKCISSALESELSERKYQEHEWLLVIAGALVFFMQTGFAMLCAGCVRKKNVQNTMLKNLLDACGAAIAWFLVGYAFAYGDSGNGDVTFLGTNNFLSLGEIDPAFWFFQYAFSATAVTIVAGTLAERCQMVAYLLYSMFLTGFVYPLVAHAVWSDNGIFSAHRDDPIGGVGVLDFAGCGVVHLTGGATALIATQILGPRQGRFYDREGRLLEKPRVIEGHSKALQLMGTMILWFGWYGFNPGSALLLDSNETGKIAAVAAVNTSLSAASGAISALFTHGFWEYRRAGLYAFDLSMAMNGTLSGLVAITASCGTVDMYAAIIIGVVAAWLYIVGSSTLVKMKIDDAVDAIPVHMLNGIWGLLAAGLFSTKNGVERVLDVDDKYGFFYHLGEGEFDATLLGIQFSVILAILVWIFATMTPFFLWLDSQGWFRIDKLEEIVGLDASFHGQTQIAQEEATPKDMERLRRRRANKTSARSNATKDSSDLEEWMNRSIERSTDGANDMESQE